jgi:hypothetical protein
MAHAVIDLESARLARVRAPPDAAPGTLAATWATYQTTTKWRGHKVSTQVAYRGIMRKAVLGRGDLPVLSLSKL